VPDLSPRPSLARRVRPWRGSSPRRAARLRRVWCVLLVGVVASTVVACSDTPGSARRAAQAFLDAVAAGRATEALALVREPTVYGQPVADRSLLTDEALAPAVREAPITHIEASLREGSTRDGRAVVDVTYDIDGQRTADSYQMVRDGGQWFVGEALPTLPAFTNHPSGVAVTVNGVLVADRGSQEDSQSTNVPVLPGRYRFGTDSPLLAVDHAQVIVTSLHTYGGATAGNMIGTGGRLPVAGPRAYLTEAGREQVAAAAEETLVSCLAGTGAAPCGRDNDRLTQWPPVVEGTASTILPGSTDLAATAPDWQGCRLPHPLDQTLTALCVDGIYTAAPVTIRTLDGGTAAGLVEVVGYDADISDPDDIQINLWLREAI